jgi:glycerophosphoryl diester phosphodiesterase
MAKFTATVPLDLRYFGNEIVGAAGATHRIEDSLADEFESQFGDRIPGFTWVVQDEATDALTVAASLATAAPLGVGSAGVVGTSERVARQDHVHGSLASVAPAAIASAGVVGTSALVARQDHTHALTLGSDDPAEVGLEATAGVATSVARSDHAHAATARRAATRANTIDIATSSTPVAIAHRGYPRTSPEQTMRSFEHAFAAGAKMFEIDIVWSADGVPMIMHDTTIDRTVETYSGSPANFTAQQLAQMDNGTHYSADFSDQGVPTLYELFERFGDKATWIVEIKANYPNETLAQTADRVADIIHEFGLDDYCILASFSEISGSTAFSEYGIPFLAYSGGISADGSVDGVAASTLYNTGYRYVGTPYNDANLAAGGNILGALGIKMLVYTVHTRYDRNVAMAATTALGGVITDDFSWIDVGRSVSVAVGTTLLFSGPRIIPAGVVPFRYDGSTRSPDVPASGRIGWSSGRLGFPTADSSTNQVGMIVGPLGWGSTGLGKFQAIVTADATTAATRFAGLTVNTDDRGHVANASTNTTTGYEVIFRQSGIIDMIRFDSTGAEVNIASATASAAMVQGSSYTLTLEVSAGSVIATGLGQTLSATDSTYRGLTYCGLIRSQLGATFSELKRIS